MSSEAALRVFQGAAGNREAATGAEAHGNALVQTRETAGAEHTNAPSSAPAPEYASDSDAAVPLVVDLDGTLVSSDLLIESAMLFAKERPLGALKLPFWLTEGRARFKQRIAREVRPDARTLPYNRALIAYVEEQRRRGRRIILATAADEAIAHDVARELGLFDAVYASDGQTNLKGVRKRDRLVAEFGVAGFDYAGNGNVDRVVWAAARKAIIVGANADVREDAARGYDVARVFEDGASGLNALVEALRVKHWFKNALVFVPLLTAHRLFDVASLSHAFAAFVAFCFCASSVYLLNDLLDLPHDRVHPHKKQRALASGRLRVGHALIVMPLLWAGAIGVSLTQPPAMLGVLALYCFLMLAYCFRLRDNVVVDVVTLAAGYALRVMAGSAATELPVAPLVVSACVLFFFGLALLKRYAELVTMRSIGGSGARGYFVGHSAVVAGFGTASGYLAIAMLMLETGFEHPLFSRYSLIWIGYALVIYWTTHIWLMARRGRITDDPVSFTLTDPVSRIVGVAVALLLLLSA